MKARIAVVNEEAILAAESGLGKRTKDSWMNSKWCRKPLIASANNLGISQLSMQSSSRKKPCWPLLALDTTERVLKAMGQAGIIFNSESL